MFRRHGLQLGNKMDRLTIGILAEVNSSVFRWSRTHSLLKSENVRVIWFEEHPANLPPRRLTKIPASLAWRILNRIETQSSTSPYERYYPKDPIALPCRFNGHFKEFTPVALDRIKSESIDLIIRIGGRGIYRDEILQTPPLGLISIHHGDNRQYRGGPPGFWEVVDQTETCGFIVQRLTKTLDGGNVLARGSVANTGSAGDNQNLLFSAADDALSNTVSFILQHRRLPPAEPALEHLGPIYKMPNFRDLLRYRKARKAMLKRVSNSKTP